MIWLPEKTCNVKYNISVEYKYNYIRDHLEIKAFLTRLGFPCLLFGFLHSDFSYLLSFKCILRTIVCTDFLNLRFCFWQQLLSLKIINLIEVMNGRELRMLGVLSCGQVSWFLCWEFTTLDGSIIDNMFLVHLCKIQWGCFEIWCVSIYHWSKMRFEVFWCWHRKFVQVFVDIITCMKYYLLADRYVVKKCEKFEPKKCKLRNL